MSRTITPAAIRCLLLGICICFPLLPQSSFDKKLQQVRYDLRVEGGKLNGKAAPVMERAIASAQYVLIGEDHLTREIPQFATAICDTMAPQGLTAIAVEVGPQVAKMVSAALRKPDRIARMAALTKQYPDSVAFLNVRQENDLAEHCAEVSHNTNFQVWGLDQEFVGSAGWLLDQILATHPGGEAAAAITRMKGEEQKAAAVTTRTGDSSKLFLFSVPDAELTGVAAVLKREGNATANEIFQELIVSHEIYLKNMQGSPESNSLRARLMKQNFRRDFEQAASNSQRPRVLLKFGDWHLYKGFNPLDQRDLGNYIAETADGQETASLHICVLGVKGTHRAFVGYNQPTKLAPFVMTDDSDYSWLKPVIQNQVSNAWTVYDLRDLRFQKLGTVDPDMKRLIQGYDFLVIVPELTPADMIQ